MKTPIILICAALALASCGPTNVNSAATEAVQASKKGVTAANALYTHASRAGADLVRLGILSRDEFKAADSNAYAVLIRVRAGQATFADLATATAMLTGGK